MTVAIALHKHLFLISTNSFFKVYFVWNPALICPDAFPVYLYFIWKLLVNHITCKEHVLSVGAKGGKLKGMIDKDVALVASTELCTQGLTFYHLLLNILPCKMLSSPSFFRFCTGSCIPKLAQDFLPAWPTLNSLVLLKPSLRVFWVYFTTGEPKVIQGKNYSQEKKKKNDSSKRMW